MRPLCERNASRVEKSIVEYITPYNPPKGDTPPRAEKKVIKKNAHHVNRQQVERQTYGEFRNVYLSSDEHANLSSANGAERLADLIERLSCYMTSRGKAYRNHYAVLRNWARNDDAKPGGGNGKKPMDTSPVEGLSRG